MKTPPAEDPYRERLKARLLQVAQAILTEEGHAGLQARRVAHDADCSVGTLYNIFGDIDGLILMANERTLHELRDVLTVAARRSAGGDLNVRLMTLAISYLDFASVNQRRWRAVFEHRLPDGMTSPSTYVEDRRQLLALIDVQLETSILDAEARSDAAHALFCAVHGIVTLSLDAKLGPFDPAKCERQIRFVVEHVVRGLGGAGG